MWTPAELTTAKPPTREQLKAANKAQTLKQAKAAFRSKGQPSLSEHETRRLERAIVLDRRAERAREKDQRHSEALRKKRLEAKRPGNGNNALLATQRTCDKFGYKSSQMHLGAFMKPNIVSVQNGEDSNMPQKDVEDNEEYFDNDSVDDDALLSALQSPSTLSKQSPWGFYTDLVYPKLPIIAPKQVSSFVNLEGRPVIVDELAEFAFDSCSQLTKEMMEEWNSSRRINPQMVYGQRVKRLGNSSDDGFDLSPEDIEELEERAKTKSRKEMLPPALPLRSAAKPDSAMKTSAGISMPPPLDFRIEAVSATRNVPKTARPSLPMVQDVGFSLTQLESFVEDELQLTQMDRG